MSVSWAFASIVSGRFMVATSYRVVAVTGALALFSGCMMLVFLRPHHGPLWASLPSFVVGIGMGLCSAVFIVSIQASVPWRQRGAATSSTMFLRFVGQAIGVAGCGAVLNLTMHTLDPGAARSVDALMSEASRHAIGTAEVARLTDIMADSLRNAYALTALFGLITVWVSFGLPRRLNPRLQIKPD
jgi:MFS family permease